VAFTADDDVVPARADPGAVSLAAVAPLDVTEEHRPADGVAERGRAGEAGRLVVAQQQLAGPSLQVNARYPFSRRSDSIA